MKRSALIGVVLLVAVAVAGLWYWRSRQSALESGAVDLIELFPDAKKQTTMASLAEGYAVQSVSIDGERKKSLFAHPFSRVTWTVQVPEGAVLRTAAALRPDTWTVDGDGATFRVGISDGQNYQQFFRQRIHPYDEPADRRWFPVEIDLSAYAGRTVDVIFNTEPGDVGNAVGDGCVWGAPRIVPGASGAARPSSE